MLARMVAQITYGSALRTWLVITPRSELPSPGRATIIAELFSPRGGSWTHGIWSRRDLRRSKSMRGGSVQKAESHAIEVERLVNVGSCNYFSRR
jgi:hypothetical protein